MEITGCTRLVGLIGWPVSHSMSPRMHNAAFRALDLDYAYVPLPVAPGRLEDALRGLVGLGFAGANVTVPHKRAVTPYLNQLTPVAMAIGAVNTLVVTPDGTLLGDNTDAYGFMADLGETGWLDASPRDCRALVIGAGGAARAVTYGLLQAGISVAIANRSFDKANELCATLGRSAPHSSHPASPRLSAHRFPEDLAALAPAANLVVNATSLGLRPGEDPLPWDPSVTFSPAQLVYDLVPPAPGAGPTALLALASAGGAKVRNGLGMLAYQGARSFESWTGVAAPLDAMRGALI